MTFPRFECACVVARLICVIGVGSSLGYAQTPIPKWTLEKELTIAGDGSDRGDIGPVPDAVVGPNGELWVVQPQSNHIKQFDRSGKLVRILGRSGDGPGEFRLIAGLGRIEDTLWVADQRQRRLSYFRGDGTFLRSEPNPLVKARMSLIAILATRRVISAELEFVTNGRDSSRFGVIRIHDRNGTNAQQMLRVATRPNTYRVDRGGGGATSFSLPFSDLPLVRASPNGKHVVIIEVPVPTSATAFFTVRRFRPDGQAISVQRNSIPAHKARESMVDSFVTSRIQAATKGRGWDPSVTRAFKAALHPGTWVPPFGKMLVDDDGVVWLQRSDESSWLVLDDSARIVGQVSLPKQNIAFAVRGEQLWTMQFDEFDVPELVRYRVRKAGHAP